MSAEKKLLRVFAATGNGREYRSLHAPGGVVPRVDAVIVNAVVGWLKGEPFAKAELTPREARKLAVELILAADQIDDRLSDEASR